MTTSVNYEFNPANYSSNVGKIDGHGCQGTVCNVTAAEGIFVDEKGQSGGDGYSATDEAPGPIMGPAAGYSIIKPYHEDRVVRDTEVPASFRGGKRTMKHKWGGKRVVKRATKKVRKMHKHSSIHKNTAGHKRSRHHKMKRTRYVRSHHKHSTMWKHTGGKAKKHHTKRHHIIMKRGGSAIGGPQPYSNIPITFGQTFDTKLGPNESALANPTPLLPYNTCATIARN